MVEKSIVLRDWEVRAVLERNKAQIRRVIKPQPNWVCSSGVPYRTLERVSEGIIKCPYHPGDRLWVKEAWAQTWTLDSDEIGVVYKADGEPPRYPYWGNERHCKECVWIPSTHMPKEATRIWLEVEDVRVKRVRDLWEWALDVVFSEVHP